MVDEVARRASYSHPRCYASSQEDCSTKISSEHVVSDAVLRLTGGTQVTVSTPPWSQDGKPKTIGIPSLTINRLCEAHNHALSPTDSTAATVARALNQWGRQALFTTEGVTGHDSVEVSGDDLQRWVLKTLIAHGELPALTVDGRPVPLVDRPKLASLLFDPGPWPAHWGLYVGLPQSNPFTLEAITSPYGGCAAVAHPVGYCIGGVVWLGGLQLVLCLFQPHLDDQGAPWEGATYRPAAVQFMFHEAQRDLRLSWSDKQQHDTVSAHGELHPLTGT